MNPREVHPITFFNEWFAEPLEMGDGSVARIVEALNRHPLADDQFAQNYVMPLWRCREHQGRFRVYGENQDTYYCFVYQGDESKTDPPVYFESCLDLHDDYGVGQLEARLSIKRIMKNNLRDLQQVQKASGKTVAQCRAALDAAKGDVADAIELLSRKGNIATDTPFDDTDWFTSPPLTRTALEATQARLGFKLPQAYVDLLYIKNGGSTKNDCIAMDRPTSWAQDHITITGIRGIGGKYGIDAVREHATNAEWGYPDFGFVFAETPTAGHTVVMFDYSECGPMGEPQVVWVDVYGEKPEVIFLAKNFTEFLSSLTDDQTFEEADGAS